MQLGFVGLGRMGANMVHRLARGGHEVVVFNRSPGPVQEAVRNGCIGASSLQDMVQKLRGPRRERASEQELPERDEGEPGMHRDGSNEVARCGTSNRGTENPRSCISFP